MEERQQQDVVKALTMDQVHFGDTVTLFSEPSALSGLGYVCFFTSSSNTCVVKYSERHDPTLRNIAGCLFEILPPLQQSSSRTAKTHDDDEVDIAHSRRSESNRQYGHTLLYGQYIQLRCVVQNRFLRSKTSKTAVLDHTNMCVDLTRKQEKDCTFRILPRYRVRSEGEPVRANDQIILESMISKNFLHCSARRFEDTRVEAGHNELDMSVIKTAFVIRPYFAFRGAYPEGVLMAGTTIRLYYKEIESYLCAEGAGERYYVSPNTYGPPEVGSAPVVCDEDVHFRQRLIGRAGKAPVPSAPSYFFRLEHQDDSAEGGPIKWTSLVRIRHVTSLALLCVEPDPADPSKLRVVLTRNQNLPGCAFRLASSIQDDVYVQEDSFVTIINVATHSILQCSPDKPPYIKRQFSVLESGSGLTAMQWDDASLFQCTPTKIENDVIDSGHAFEITVVPNYSLAELNRVQSIAPAVAFCHRKLVTPLRANERFSEMYYEMFCKELTRLHTFLGTARKPRQKLLRHMGIVSELMDILHFYDRRRDSLVETLHAGFTGAGAAAASTSPKHREMEAIRKVMIAIYDVLDAYVSGQSPKNELFIARDFAMFLAHVPLSVHSESMLVNLVEDNMTLLSNVSEAQVALFLHELAKKPTPQFLDFLRILCVCEGQPMPENQTLIATSLEQGVYLDKLMQTSVVDDPQSRNNGKMVIVTLAHGDDANRKIERFSLRDLSNSLYAADQVPDRSHHQSVLQTNALLLEKQLDLFASLCAGRNLAGLHLVARDELVDYDEAFLVLSDDSLHPIIRNAYARLLLYAFVDAGDNVPDMECIDHNFSWKSLQKDTAGDDDDTMASTGMRFAEFPKLKDFIKDFLTHKAFMKVEDDATNRLILTVLQIAHKCAIFGLYTSQINVHALVEATTKVLKVQSDKFTMPLHELQQIEEERKRKLAKQSSLDNPTTASLASSPIGVLSPTSATGLLPFFRGPTSPSAEYEEPPPLDQTQSVADYIGRDWNETYNKVKIAALELLQVLGNLRLRRRLFEMMTRFKAQKGQLVIDRMRPTGPPKDRHPVGSLASDLETILTAIREQDHLDPNKELDKVLQDLSKFADRQVRMTALGVLDRQYSGMEELLYNASQSQILVDESLSAIHGSYFSRKSLAVFRQQITRDVKGKEQQDVLGFLHRMANICTLSGMRSEMQGTDVLEPHRANQDMLYYAGILEDIFVLVHRTVPLKGVPESTAVGILDLIAAGFQLLRVMMMENNPIQSRIFDRVDQLLELPHYRENPYDFSEPIIRAYQNLQTAKAGALAEVFTSAEQLCLKVHEKTIAHIIHYTAHEVQSTPAMLSVLEAIIMVEEFDLPLKRNQNFIMKHLPSYRTSLFHLIDTKNSAEAQKTVLSEGNINTNPLAFHLAVVDLLATMCQGENRSVESMCQTIFSLSSCISVISNESYCLEIKMPYLRFLLWVYMNASGSIDELGTHELLHNQRIWQFMRNFVLPFLTTRVANVAWNEPHTVRSEFNAFQMKVLFVGIVPFIQIFFTRYFVLAEVSKEDLEVCMQIVRALASHVIDPNDHPVLPLLVRDDLQGPALIKAVYTMCQRLGETGIPRHIEMRLRAAQAHGINPLRSRMRAAYDMEMQLHNELNGIMHTWVEKLSDEFQTKNEGPVSSLETADGRIPDNEEFHDLMCNFCTFDTETHPSSAVHRIPRSIKSVKDAIVLVVQFKLGLERSVSDEYNEIDKRVNQALAIKSLLLFRGMLRYEGRRYLKYDKEEKRKKELVKGQRRVEELKTEILNIGMLDAVVEAFRFDAPVVHMHCFRFLVDFFDGAAPGLQAYFHKHFRHFHGHFLFENVRSRLFLAINGMKERRMLAAALRSERDTIEMNPKLREIIKFRDDVGSKIVLRFLKELCNNEHKNNQALCRSQSGHMSVDLLLDCLTYLSALQRNRDPEAVKMLSEVLRTIRYLVQGNIQNMVTVIDAKLLDSLNHIIRIDLTDHQALCLTDQFSLQLSLKRASFRLLLALIEYTSPDIQRIAIQVFEQIDTESLLDNLKYYWVASKGKYDGLSLTTDQKKKAREFTRTLAYVVIMRLNDLEPDDCPLPVKELLRTQEHRSLLESAFPEVAKTMASVEIKRDNHLQRVHFPLPEGLDIRPEMKEDILYSVQRDRGPNGKVDSFVERAAEHIYQLRKRRVLMKTHTRRFIISHGVLWRNLAMCTTLVINLLMLIEYNGSDHFTDYSPERTDATISIIYFFGAIHLVLSIILLTNHSLIGNRTKEIVPLFQSAKDHSGETYMQTTLRYVNKCLPSGLTVYYILYLICSILGFPLYGYTYCFHMLHFAVGSTTLEPILTAVTSAREQLGWVALLLLFIMYNFTLFSFAFFRSMFSPEDGNYCYTMYQCFLTVTSYGLRSGGGLGDILVDQGINPDLASMRVPFDLLFWMLITVVGLNIVFTVIVGNFATLREERAELDEDVKRNCLICSKESYDFEMYGNGFKAHREREHNPFHYVSFFMHLMDTPEDEYTSHEASVVRSMKKNDHEFFPLGEAIALERRAVDSDRRQLDNAVSIVTALVQRVDKETRERYRQHEHQKMQDRERRVQSGQNDGRGAGPRS